MSRNFIANVDCWVVVWGPIPVMLVEVSTTQQFTTGQDNAEVLLSRAEAVARAREIDPSWIDPLDPIIPELVVLGPITPLDEPT